LWNYDHRNPDWEQNDDRLDPQARSTSWR
jgi:hypothetical protein